MFAATIFVCLIATALRIAAARGELWLDEVWSIRLVQEHAHSPSDIFLHLQHDNNHVLNSLWVYVVGPDRSPWMYRWPAVVAGALTVCLASWFLRRGSPMGVFTVVMLTGFSFLLVQYSSEARGYAHQLLLSIMAYGALRESDSSRSIGWDLLFSVSCVLGFLAHPLFANVYLAAQVWTWWPWRERQQSDHNPRPWLRILILRTVVPGAFFAWLYWVSLATTMTGGGEITPLFVIVLQTMSLVVGGPFGGPGAYAAAGITALVTLAAFWIVSRQSPQRASFYLVVIVLSPALLQVVVPRQPLYPRYFLGSVLFLLLLWAEGAGETVRRRAANLAWLCLLLAAFVVANLWHISRLIELGRGHYQQAIQTMEEQNTGPEVRVAIDHEFRHGMMLELYGPRTHLSKPIRTAFASPESVRMAQWLLVQNPSMDYLPQERIEKYGVSFRLVRYYPYAGLSGWNLCLYRRDT